MAKSIYDEVNISIKPLLNEIKVEVAKKGVRRVKNISLEDLIKSMTGSRVESKVIVSGFLPENCLSVKISDALKSIVLWRRPQQCDYTYFKTLFEGFPLPCMVFGFDIDPEGKVEGYRMAMVETGVPKPTTKLYEYPFSNVYKHTGICVGAANELPVYKNFHSLASLPNHILSLPNNDHNFSREYNRLHLGYRELLEHLQDKDAAYYYDKILVPRGDGKTLQDFIDQNIHGY